MRNSDVHVLAQGHAHEGCPEHCLCNHPALVGFVVPAESSHNEKTCVYACLHVCLRRGNLFVSPGCIVLVARSNELVHVRVSARVHVCLRRGNLFSHLDALFSSPVLKKHPNVVVT
jgi:hypothetical protein